MDHSEILFRNGCRKWHTYLECCARDGQVLKASQLLSKIVQYLDDWKKSLTIASAETRDAQKRVIECRRKEASINLRMRMLGQLLTVMDRKFANKESKRSGGDNE